MDPVTRQFSLSWRPEVRFFERRLEPLKALDARGEVHSFRVRQNDITVSVKDPYQELRYGSAGVSIRLADALGDSEHMFNVVADVFKIFEPETLGLARANLQFLEELSGDYDSLRKNWGSELVNTSAGVSISDWAVLINPDVHSDPPWAGALEFGIVAGEEALERLSREFGKLTDEPLGEASDRISLPDVAFFADSHWTTAARIEDSGNGLLQASVDSWNIINQKISELASQIKSDYTRGATA